jgi:leucyl aminopeptidase
MHPIFARAGKTPAIPIWFVHAGSLASIRKELGERERTFVDAANFEAKPGRSLLLPAADGKLAGLLFGIEKPDAPEVDRFRPGLLAGLLPPGRYRFANSPHDARLAALAFALGTYQFARYRKAEAREVTLVPPDGVDAGDLSRII